MRSTITAAVFAVLSAVGINTALGHGFTTFLNGNKLMAESEDNTTLHNGTLNFSFEELSGFKALVGGGLQVPPDTFNLELFGPLWFSDGGPAVLADVGIELIVDSYSDGSFSTLIGTATRSPLTAGSATLAVVGDDDDSMIFTLTGPITSGVYGIGMRLHGFEDGNLLTPFDPSDPLVITLRTPGFGQSDPAMLSEARIAVFDAAVPEPSAVLLALIAAGWLMWLRWNRQDQPFIS